MEASRPINTFVGKFKALLASVGNLSDECQEQIDKLWTMVLEIRDPFHNFLQRNRDGSQKKTCLSKELLRFTESVYVLVAPSEFSPDEKLSLRWRGPRRILQPIFNYVYLVEDLRNGEPSKLHISRVKFYRDADLNSNANATCATKRDQDARWTFNETGKHPGRVASVCALEGFTKLRNLNGTDQSSLRRNSWDVKTSSQAQQHSTWSNR